MIPLCKADIMRHLGHWTLERAAHAYWEARARNCQFIAGDMGSWAGGSGLSLIVIEDALYYLAEQQQRALLGRCARSLRPGGRILVTAHSGQKHLGMLKVCRETCAVLEEVVDGRMHLVLGPRAAI